jgi:hypothetical protein
VTVTGGQGHANQLALVADFGQGDQAEGGEGNGEGIGWDHPVSLGGSLLEIVPVSGRCAMPE